MKKFLLLAALAVSSPALAKTTFEPVESRTPDIYDGQGGTRTTKHDIDYWTSGDPPRRYQVIGVIRDSRGTGPLDGDAVGSKGIAKLVKKNGCNAVIILSRKTRQVGTYQTGNANANATVTPNGYGGASASGNASAYGYTMPVNEASAFMVVVKYLPDPAPN